MLRLSMTLSLLSVLASCREGRDSSSAMPEDEQEDASAMLEPSSDAQVLESGVGASLDGASARDAHSEPHDSSAAGADASRPRADGGSANPSDAAAADAASTADAAARADGGPALSGCTPLALNNTQGVGDGCTEVARELACPATRTCLEGLVEQGLQAPEPYFCTKSCTQNAECGESARCCRPRGWSGKICVLDSCQGSCE